MKLLNIFALTGVLLLLESCSGGGKFAGLESELDDVARRYNCVGMSVAAVKGDKIVWLGNFGVKNIKSGEPVDRNTLYRIASISKSFAGTAMMQLVDQGLITLDTDVSTVAGFPIRNPKFPDTPITLEMLMCHLSSIDDFGGYTSMDYLNPEVNPDWQSCYLDCEPGTEYHYSEFNFGIVAALLEKLTGERFDEYVKEHILDPLHIAGGYIPDSLDAECFASLYNVTDSAVVERPEAYASRSEVLDNYRLGVSAPGICPSSAVIITAEGLATYMLMHMNHGWSPTYECRILSEESALSMQASHTGDEGYGLGLGRTAEFISGVETVGHTGGAYGLRSVMCFNRNADFGVVMICSGSREPFQGEPSLFQAVIQPVYKALF